MKRLGYAVFTAFMLLLAALSPALADHMNGSYAGVGVDEGINLAITQSGTTVTGQLTGNENGFLEGVSDGGDNVSGTISLNDGTVFQFTAVWSAASFDITLFDNTGTTELHSFVPATGDPQPEPEPEPDTASTQYWVYDSNQQYGPLSLDQVLARIASGESNRETQVWTVELNTWVLIDTVPEFVEALGPVAQPEPDVAAIEYWTFDNEQQFGPFTLQQVLDRIASGESNRETQIWTSTNQQWVMIDTVAELAAALPTVEQDVAEKPSYYLYYQGNQSGPYTTQQMLDGIAQGTVPRGSLVWQPGWAEWVRVETVEQFAVAFPPAVPADIQYFVIVNGERVGPLTEADVNARITSLESRATDLAWKRGLEAWAPLSTFAEFADAIAAVETPPVPPTDVEVPPIVEPEVEEPPQLPDDVVEPPEVVEPEVPDVPEVVETPEVIEEPEVIEPPEVVEEEVVEEEKEKREEAVARKAKIAEALERLKGAE